MRIITKYGIGATKNQIAKNNLEVELEKPYEGQAKKTMSPSEMFPFTSNGALRMANIKEIGSVSSLCFVDPVQVDMMSKTWHLPSNECILIFNLFDGKFSARNLAANGKEKPFLFLQPHINRWAREVPRTFGTYEEALGYTERSRKVLPGIGDINASILLDVPKSKVLWIFIVTRPSKMEEIVALERKFV